MDKVLFITFFFGYLWVSLAVYQDGLSDVAVEVYDEPCASIKCSSFFQTPVPPSCECKCLNEHEQCPPLKVFNTEVCECLCKDINFYCPGQSDFDFNTCKCAGPLQKQCNLDCPIGYKLDKSVCQCKPICPHQLQCQGKFNPVTCKCECTSFKIQTSYSYYNRYNYGNRRYHNNYNNNNRGYYYKRPSYFSRHNDQSRSRRSDSSDSGSDSDSGGAGGKFGKFRKFSFIQGPRCPERMKVDWNKCLCYW